MIKKMKCPCQGCTTRTVTCHANCRRYEDWKIYDKAVKDDLREHGALYCSDQAIRAHWDKIKRPTRKHKIAE